MGFVHLQCQTVYSLLKSACKIDVLVRRAKELGFTALAITDEDVMYGVIPFYQACKKEGIKPIIGLTASVQSGEHGTCPLVLLAENDKGYQNLIKISSAIMTKARDGIPKKWLARYAEGLIAISPGRTGEIEQLLLEKRDEEAERAAYSYREMFSSFYLSLQQHDIQQERFLNTRLMQFSEQSGIPLLVTNDVKYVYKKDAELHECLLCIEHGAKITDEARPRLHSQEYDLKSAEEMYERFSYIPEALHETEAIAERCDVTISFHVSRLPKFPVPTGETSDEYLRRLCEEGLKKRYIAITDAHRYRMRHELEVIARMGFSDYFLIVADFMKYAHDQGILTGPGRGSAAGSLVAYVLYITNVDPLRYGLLFERFLNPERITLPDIDIDFPDVRRDEVIQYVAQKYGQLHVAQIITYGTLAARAAVRDIARVMGLSQREMDQLARLIPSKVGITLEQAYHESNGLREFIESKPLYRRVYSIAKEAEGIPRHTSVHAAGVIMSDASLTDHVALQEGHDDVYVTQYAADILEELGLLKMDFLGLRNLTLLEHILSLISSVKGEKLSLERIPLTDQAAFKLLGRGDTTGIFQLESAGMRDVLVSLQPTEFEDIVAVNALYRPGPMEQIPTFIEAKHGKRTIRYPHPDLKPILQSTYGVVVYQEQIMQIASTMAGFSLGEADLLRRAVSKKNRDILDKERSHFVNGCSGKGYDEQTAHAVYDLIVQFANYGFNRSHAVAYSMIAYQLAYLKANYPLEFSAALLSSAIGNEDKIVQYVREMKRSGISILPPSIQQSTYRFRIEGDSIRFSLLGIRNIGIATVKEIIEERKKKPFEDLFDFCVRLPGRVANRKHLDALIKAGCFDDFGVDRAFLLASVDAAIEYAELVRPSDDYQEDMFLDEDLVPKPHYIEAEMMSSEEKCKWEKELLGFHLSAYPTEAYEPLMKELRISTLREAVANKSKSVRVIVYIEAVRVIRTKAMQNMAFLTMSDRDEEMEAVVFPDVYVQCLSHIQDHTIVLLEGSIGVRNHKTQIIASGIYPLEPMKTYETGRTMSLYIKVPSLYDKQVLRNVNAALLHFPGFCQTFLYYEKEHKMVQLPRECSVHPGEACVQALRDIVGVENVVLKM